MNMLHVPFKRPEHKPIENKTIQTLPIPMLDIEQIKIIIASFFIGAGLLQIIKGKSYEQYALQQGVVNSSNTVKFAALALIALGITALIPKIQEYGFYGLCIFQVISALSIHKFWEGKTSEDRVSESLHFAKNIVIGVLLFGLTLV